jgi:RNA polymerase sigma factor (sigma-70 family)
VFKIAGKKIYDDNYECIDDDKDPEYDEYFVLEVEDDADFEDEDEDETEETVVTDFGILGEIDFGELEEIDDIEMLHVDAELSSLRMEHSMITPKLLEEMAETEALVLDKPTKAVPRKRAKSSTEGAIILDSIRKYQKDISRYELLTREEEVALSRRWHNSGDQAAFHKLVVSNLRLVISIAQKYRNNGLDFNEIIQEGNIGLIRALERYDPEAGYRVSTYATWWIRQCIVRGLADKSRHIRLPVHVNEKVIKIEKVKNLLQKKLYRNPTIEEMQPFLKDSSGRPMPLSEIASVIDAVKDVSSINITVGDDGNSTISDFIEDKTIQDPATEISRKNLRGVLGEFINDLPEREKYIIERRFNLDGTKNQTLEEIGTVLGVTRERVRQLEVKGLKLLREKMIERDMNKGDFI